MRIIDKISDFYDYLQYREDDLVFDRRGSYILQKEHILISVDKALNAWHGDPDVFFLLQCGATYWLLLVRGLNVEGERRDKHAKDYTIRVVDTWKNYNREIDLLRLQAIYFNLAYQYNYYDSEFKGRRYIRTLNEDKVVQVAPKLRDAIIHKDYEVFFDYKTIKRYDYEGNGKPLILKACGIPKIIAPEDMYNAIDEYFSLMKTAAESTVAEGTTNNDKIKNHGFDTKTSFRGK